MPMIATAGTFILQVFEQHLDMLGAAWARRRVALYSPDYTGVSVAELDELIETHLDGLAAAGEDALPLLVSALLGGEAIQTFATASGKKLEAIRDAFAHGSADQSKEFLHAQFVGAALNVAIAAAEALAFVDGFSLRPEQLELFIRAEDASVKAASWRLAYYGNSSLAPELYAVGLCDADDNVRR